MRRRLAHGLALVVWVAGLGAAQGPNNSEATPAPSRSDQNQPHARKQTNKVTAYQIGTASWYGKDFVGKPTANGEPYNMYDMTAAHPTLPLGSFVRVTNLRNGKAVVVRINDRGPIVPGRIIDLSYEAADALQFKSRGLQRVRLDVVGSGPARPHLQTVADNRPPADLPSR